MRTRFFFALTAALFAFAGTAFAACPSGYVLKKIGNVQTADANVTTQGRDVHAILVDCSATACLAGFWNLDDLAATADADVVAEVGAAASTSIFLDLTDSPLYFSEGITFLDDNNVDAAILYSCSPR